MMTDLWDYFGKVVKEDRLQFCENGKFILKNTEEPDEYEATVLSNNNDNLVVFDVECNSHASFVTPKYYSRNCDYIFIQINNDNINFILCELKSKGIGKSFSQLKCSIPLMYYLKGLLITHCGEELKKLKIKHKKVLPIRKVLLIDDMSQKTTITNKSEIDNDVHIFYGNEFSSNELFNS